MEKRLADSNSKICSFHGDEHKIPFSEFIQRLGVNDKGLSAQEAAKRLQECGPNILKEIGKESLLKKYLSQFRNFFSILLIGYFCTKPRKGILRNENYNISNILKLSRGS